MEEGKRRKLLVASIGAATIYYVACTIGPRGDETSGNLVGPPEDTAPSDGLVIDTATPETTADTGTPADSTTPDGDATDGG